MEYIPSNKALTEQSLLTDRMDKLYKLKEIASQRNLTNEDKAAIAKASRGFESLFVNMMLKEMKKGLLDEKKEDSFGSDTLMSFADMEFSNEVSSTGSGIGIADLIYQQLTGEKLNPILKEIASKVIPKNINENISSSDKVEISKNSQPLNSGFIQRMSDKLENYRDIIAKASTEFGVPENLIKSVIVAESAGRPDARSSAGAKGLMQLMDGTAKDLGVANSYNPEQNIMGGTKYLKAMLDKFGGNVSMALAAYNAGPGNVQKYGGIPPFEETQAYIRRVQKFNEDFMNL